MPMINIEDSYILGETGAQVDKVTGLYFKNENASDTEKAQARANIGAGGSNRNLLDNAYFVGGGSQLGDGVFPINQRGQTSYAGGGTSIDRWKTWAGDDTITLTANGVQYTSPTSNGLFQYAPLALPADTMTASAKIGGTIYTMLVPEGTNEVTQDFSGFRLYVNRSGKAFGVMSLNTQILIQAVKLEKGTYTTLANDVPPDFGEELLKCQMYLRYVPFIRTLIALESTYTIAIKTLEGIEMASYPTASLTQAGTVKQFSTSAWATPTGVSVIAFNHYTPTIQFSLSSTLDGVGYIVDTIICLSCEP